MKLSILLILTVLSPSIASASTDTVCRMVGRARVCNHVEREKGQTPKRTTTTCRQVGRTMKCVTR